LVKFCPAFTWVLSGCVSLTNVTPSVSAVGTTICTQRPLAVIVAPLGFTIFQVSRYVPDIHGAAQPIENVYVLLGGTDPLTNTVL
jgi:hypothetical protein